MLASLLTYVEHPELLFASIPTLAFVLFDVWMIIHAARNRDWLWVVFMVAFPFSCVWYFFTNFRQAPSLTQGFELPGAHSRRRIKELKAQIHHLDKPHHHLQLGDIYFQQGKLDLAETEYRAAFERDKEDRDTRSHLGQCLLRKKKPKEALPLLESVASEDPRHDYGHTMMALAETYQEVGQMDAAINVWKRVLENYSYARARVQLAELLLTRNDRDAAAEQINEVIETDPHAPAFDRKRNRVWVRRARKLQKQL
jgi:tetratricopeptide (TPR) repeat protein